MHDPHAGHDHHDAHGSDAQHGAHDKHAGHSLSGPPHNVAFWKDSIPQGAAGEYGYYCVPHVALGMVASLTVQ